MKTIKLLPVFLIAISFVGCKENQAKKEAITEDVIEETTVGVVPRESDMHFQQALSAYENNNKPEAVKEINAGIDALDKEAKDVSGLYKMNMEAARDQLRNIAGKLDDNFDISIEGYREAVANAEINVAHNYLATDDVYMLTPKEKVKENYLHRALDRDLINLEAGTKKLEGDAKKEGQKLDVEGIKLKKDFEDWARRADEHAKKVEEHFVKNKNVYDIS